MPDIAMCKGEGCPIKKSCYRYGTEPAMFQSFFANPPFNHETASCDYYWDNKLDSFIPFKSTKKQK